MYWIIGILVLIIIVYFMSKGHIVTKNISSRYFALKDYFKSDENISVGKLLELSGIFSQIVYVRNMKISIDEIKEYSESSAKIYNGTKETEIEMLVDFCAELTTSVYIAEGLNYMEAINKVEKEKDKIKKVVISTMNKGYSKIIYKSNLNKIQKYPELLN